MAREQRLQVDFEGEGEPRLRLVFTGTSKNPPETEQDLAIFVAWPRGVVKVGVPFTVELSVANLRKHRIHAPMVVVPIPTGCRVDRAALRAILMGTRIERHHIREGRIELYMNEMGREEKLEFSLPLIPEFRGRISSAPVRAYPYYEPERATVTRGARFRVW
jgi:hypothetical protein